MMTDAVLFYNRRCIPILQWLEEIRHRKQSAAAHFNSILTKAVKTEFLRMRIKNYIEFWKSIKEKNNGL